ncbi:MAG: acyltransferase, partial [Acidimicrobiales bacterium]
MTETVAPSHPTDSVGALGDSVFDKFPHFPALDGLRGLAVAAVLVFHGGFSWASGGFLGVSTFFTLSGFLITSLLLAEQRREGQIALGAFWVRRFKRLMPAAVAAIGSIYVFWTLFPGLQDDTSFTDVSVLDRLNGDLFAALVYVANWRFAFPPEGAGYENLFGEVGEPSPAAHFWSLSVEEQFYVFFPLIAMILLSILRLSKAAFAGVLGVFLIVSLAMLVPLSGFDRIYNGTDIRAAEILVGALLAV